MLSCNKVYLLSIKNPSLKKRCDTWGVGGGGVNQCACDYVKMVKTQNQMLEVLT